MAITINSTPENYASAHDDLWFVVTSNNTAQTNFKYVFDVYVASTQVARVKSFPDPSSSKGIFNAGNIIRNYLTSYFKPQAGTQTLFTYDGNDIYVPYEVKYGEEYGGTTYTNLATNTVNAYNIYNPIFRDPSTSFFSGYVSEWLTGRDLNNVDVNFNESCFVSWMNASGADVSTTATIQLYNEDGTTQGSPYTTTSVNVSSFGLFDISPIAINTGYGSSIITSSVSNYGVKLNYASTSGDEIKCRVVCNPRYTPTTLHFLNSLGGYDSLTFRLVNKQSRSVDKKEYQQMHWSYNAGSTSMRTYNTNNVINAGNIPFSTNQQTTFKLRTDYLNATDWTWSRDLIASPEIYMKQGNYYYPVTIRTSNWEEKLKYVDKMNFLEIDIEYSRTINSQFR